MNVPVVDIVFVVTSISVVTNQKRENKKSINKPNHEPTSSKRKVHCQSLGIDAVLNPFETKNYFEDDPQRKITQVQDHYTHVESSNFDCFPALHECFNELNFKVDEEVSKVFLEHLRNLKTTFLQYFPKTSKDDSWVRNPFSVTAKPVGLSASDYENLIDLISDSDLKQKYKDQPLNDFLASLSEEYPNFSKQAIIVLLPLSTTYLRKAGFSYYAATKSKCRNRLDATPDIRTSATSWRPKTFTFSLCSTSSAITCVAAIGYIQR